MTVAERETTAIGTASTAGARRIGEAFARARAEGRAALIPYIVAGYPDADGSLAAATRRDRRRRGPAGGRPAVLGPAGRRRDPPAGEPGRPRRRRDVRRVPRARPADRAGAPRHPARPDGLREPAHRRRRWSRPGAGPGRRGRERRHRRGPHARRRGAVRGGRRGGRARRRLPRRADDPPRPPRRDRRPDRRLPLLRVACGRDGRPGQPAAVGDEARSRGEGRVAGTGRGRVRRLEAGARAGDRARRRRRRDRRVGARRRTRPGRT